MNLRKTPNVKLMAPSEISLYKYLVQSMLASIGITPLPIAFPKDVPYFSIKNSVKNQLIHIGMIIQNISGCLNGAPKIESQYEKSCHKFSRKDNKMLKKLKNIHLLQDFK